MLLTQQQHLSHVDGVRIVFHKYRVRVQQPQEWEKTKWKPLMDLVPKL